MTQKLTFEVTLQGDAPLDKYRDIVTILELLQEHGYEAAVIEGIRFPQHPPGYRSPGVSYPPGTIINGIDQPIGKTRHTGYVGPHDV